MIFLELFFSFLKVGFSSFGGLSMVPVINAEMLSHGWMTQEQVIDIIAIAEMTPGPMGMNCACAKPPSPAKSTGSAPMRSRPSTATARSSCSPLRMRAAVGRTATPHPTCWRRL